MGQSIDAAVAATTRTKRLRVEPDDGPGIEKRTGSGARGTGSPAAFSAVSDAGPDRPMISCALVKSVILTLERSGQTSVNRFCVAARADRRKAAGDGLRLSDSSQKTRLHPSLWPYTTPHAEPRPVRGD